MHIQRDTLLLVAKATVTTRQNLLIHCFARRENSFHSHVISAHVFCLQKLWEVLGQFLE